MYPHVVGEVVEGAAPWLLTASSPPLASLVGLPIGRHGSFAHSAHVLMKLGALGFDDLQPELSLESFG